MKQGSRRAIPRALREKLFIRSEGICERPECETTIELETFHVSHIRSHTHGGVEDESNLEAWCPPCNRRWGARDAGDPRLTPREWQLEALESVARRIRQDHLATLSAAPGSGKTIFTGLLFEELAAADFVDRMVVVVPRLNLQRQWRNALLSARHLQLKADGTAIERPGEDGVIVTYPSLLNEKALENHRALTERDRTLLVLDEVHHIGEAEHSAWARSVTKLAGHIDDLQVEAVLNLSGTLWRTSNKSRISTIRYLPVDEGRWESHADYVITTKDLVDAGELRPIELWKVDGRVEIWDRQTLDVSDRNIADLDEADDVLQSKVLREQMAHAGWRTGFVSSVLDRLQEAYRSLDGYQNVKALIVAASQFDAKLLHTEVDRQMIERKLGPISRVAVSEDGTDAAKTLESFANENGVGVLCTVDMAGEGYDVPDICVIGYASLKRTRLYINQVMGRAMRVTDREREILGRPMTAAVVVPDMAILVNKLNEYTSTFQHEIEEPDDDGDNRDSPGDGDGSLRDERYLLQDLRPTETEVTVPLSSDEVYSFPAALVSLMADSMTKAHLPGSEAAHYLAALQMGAEQWQHLHPFDPMPDQLRAIWEQIKAPKTESAHSVEEDAAVLQMIGNHYVKWWAKNGRPSTPVAHFTADANRAAGLPTSNGWPAASLEQLRAVIDHMWSEIEEYCEESRTRRPTKRHDWIE